MTPPDPDDTRPDPGPDSGRPDSARPDTARSQSGSEPTGPDDSRRPGLPDDIDAAFASIVADWAAAGAPRWPDEPFDPDVRREDGPSSGLGTATPPGGAELGSQGTDLSPAPPAPPAPRPQGEVRPTPPVPPKPPAARPTPPPEDEHFVPPEPPPLPRLGLSSMLGLGMLVIGVVLLAVPGLLGGPVGLGIVPGLLAMTAGLGWLVFGLRRGRDEGTHGSDDGAVL
ncbi:hypothetical protein [Actinomycetospora cinnamomea]|uniref:Uncharacterized protein n=1 Tax=Actinomycetospora cinnamomea TaxID=663609 RepID=A0A2U1F9S9_9PSEU|nr:hypothetical protein [Actinomycetospora cinnamomea]PVZ08947.1 hypothetical protein C8D89_107109 [Actinomycetospora cinnamomea]